MPYPVYDAPHKCTYANGGGVSRQYAVVFKPGHTLEKHLAYLQSTPAVHRELPRKIDRKLDNGYVAELVENECAVIRLDPRVESFTESTTANEDSGHIHQARYIRAAGGPYLDHDVVLFSGHTLAQHFDFLGRNDFEHYDYGDAETGFVYNAELGTDLRDAIRRDPGVQYVSEGAPGEEEGESDE